MDPDKGRVQLMKQGGSTSIIVVMRTHPTNVGTYPSLWARATGVQVDHLMTVILQRACGALWNLALGSTSCRATASKSITDAAVWAGGNRKIIVKGGGRECVEAAAEYPQVARIAKKTLKMLDGEKLALMVDAALPKRLKKIAHIDLLGIEKLEAAADQGTESDRDDDTETGLAQVTVEDSYSSSTDSFHHDTEGEEDDDSEQEAKEMTSENDGEKNEEEVGDEEESDYTSE